MMIWRHIMCSLVVVVAILLTSQAANCENNEQRMDLSEESFLGKAINFEIEFPPEDFLQNDQPIDDGPGSLNEEFGAALAKEALLLEEEENLNDNLGAVGLSMLENKAPVEDDLIIPINVKDKPDLNDAVIENTGDEMEPEILADQSAMADDDLIIPINVEEKPDLKDAVIENTGDEMEPEILADQSTMADDYVEPSDDGDDDIQCPLECECTDTSMTDNPVGIKVDCAGKSLSSIPIGIDEKVNVLLLGENDLTSIPADFTSGFPDLKRLSLSGNKITEIEIGAFHSASDLISIQLDGNLLTQIPEEIITLENLESLHLEGNPIDDPADITAVYFSQMSNIKKLILPVNAPESLVNEICKEHNTLNVVFIGEEEHLCASVAVETPVEVKTPKEEPHLEVEPQVKVEVEGEPPIKAEAEPSYEAEVPPVVEEGPSLMEDIKKQDEAIQASAKQLLENASQGVEANIDQVKKFLESTLEEATKASDSAISKALVETEETIKAVKKQTSDKLIEALGAASKAAKEANIVEQAPGEAEEAPKTKEEKAIAFETPIHSFAAPKIEGQQEPPFTSIQGESEQKIKPLTITPDVGKGVNKLEEIKEDPQPKIEGKTEATKAETGGRVDNMIIGLIVAGMICVVAGITVKKNWGKIKRKFAGPQAANTAPSNGRAPQAAPEETEPLRDPKATV